MWPAAVDCILERCIHEQHLSYGLAAQSSLLAVAGDSSWKASVLNYNHRALSMPHISCSARPRIGVHAPKSRSVRGALRNERQVLTSPTRHGMNGLPQPYNTTFMRKSWVGLYWSQNGCLAKPAARRSTHALAVKDSHREHRPRLALRR
jgi:hypothetical protein